MKFFTDPPRVLKFAKIKVDKALESELQAVYGDFVLCTLTKRSRNNELYVSLDGGDDGGATRVCTSLAEAEDVYSRIKREPMLTSAVISELGFERW